MTDDKNESKNSELQKITNVKNKSKRLKSGLNVIRKKKTKQYSKLQSKKPEVGKAEVKKKAEAK